MKKIALILCGAFIYLASFGQAVNDKAVIPVSVNLNSILRLTILSGGNIEFTFNTIEDYNDGITGPETVFAVSSSQDFDITISAETATLQGTDSASNTLSGNYISIYTDETTATTEEYADNTDQGQLSTWAAGVVILDACSAGAAEDNEFTIHWECGTTAAGGSLLGIADPDRYAVNVFLTVSPD